MNWVFRGRRVMDAAGPGTAWVGLAALLFTLLCARPVDSLDVWWQLNAGGWTLTNGSPLLRELWSFTVEGEEWNNVAWLFQATLALFYRIGGDWGLLLLKLSLIYGLFLLLIRPYREIRYFFPVVLSFLILLPAVYGHMHLRPHMIEVLLLAAVMQLVRSPLDLRRVGLGVVLLVVWANVHASVVVGAVAMATQALLGRWSEERGRGVRWFAAVVFAVTPFCSPLGVKILNLLFSHGGSDAVAYYIQEWVSHRVYPAYLWLPFIAVALAGGARRVRVEPLEWFLLLFFLYYSLKSQRFEMELAVVLLRFLPEVLSQAFAAVADVHRRAPALAGAMLVALHGLVYWPHLQELAIFNRPDLPVDRSKYPRVSTRALVMHSEELGRPVRVINDYAFGGYVAFHSRGAARIMIDGRTPTIFPESLLILNYENNGRLLKKLADSFAADAILLKLNRSGVLSLADPGWVLAAYDSASVLFVRRGAAGTLPRIGYDPAVYSNAFAEGEASMHLGSTERLLDIGPDNHVALNHAAMFLSQGMSTPAQQDEVDGLLAKAQALAPRDRFAQATRALLEARAVAEGQGAAARLLELLPAPNALGPEVGLEHRFAYTRALIEVGRPAKALEYLYPGDADSRVALDRQFEAWRLRILGHKALNDLDSVDFCLTMAGYLARGEQVSQLAEMRDGLGRPW